MQRAAELLCPKQEPLFYTQAHERAADVLLQHGGVCAALHPHLPPSLETNPFPAVPRLPAPRAHASTETQEAGACLDENATQHQSEGRASTGLSNKLAPACLCKGGKIAPVGRDNLHEAARVRASGVVACVRSNCYGGAEAGCCAFELDGGSVHARAA